MAYRFYIDGVLLPVTPEKMEMKSKSKNKTIDLINSLEVNVLNVPGLLEIGFDAMLPQRRYPFAVYEGGFHDAKYYLEKWERLRVGRKKFRFLATRVSPGGELLFDTNLRVSMEACAIKEDAGDGGDATVSIRLKEFRDYGAAAVKMSAQTEMRAASAGVRQRDSAPAKKTHTVVKGDCLWNIARQYLGDGNRYKEIYELNKGVVDKGNAGTGNPRYTIYPGQVFQMPT